MARREKTTLVSIECLRPCMSHSFCKSMGTLSVTDGFDLHLTDLGDDYGVDVGSRRGAALLAGLNGRPRATDDDQHARQPGDDREVAALPLRLEFDVTELPSLMSVSYDSEVVGRARRSLPGLRHVHQRLPDLLLLQRRRRGRSDAHGGQALPRVGLVPAGQVRHGGRRPQLPRQAQPPASGTASCARASTRRMPSGCWAASAAGAAPRPAWSTSPPSTPGTNCTAGGTARPRTAPRRWRHDPAPPRNPDRTVHLPADDGDHRRHPRRRASGRRSSPSSCPRDCRSGISRASSWRSRSSASARRPSASRRRPAAATAPSSCACARPAT